MEMKIARQTYTWAMTLLLDRSRELQRRAEALIPGGVDSPVRAFRSVGGDPPFVDRAEGAYLYDVDGNRYIDFFGSWGRGPVSARPPRQRRSLPR